MAKFQKLPDGWAQCIDGVHPGCGYKWRLRTDEPIYCAGCHIPFENTRGKRNLGKKNVRRQHGQFR